MELGLSLNVIVSSNKLRFKTCPVTVPQVLALFQMILVEFYRNDLEKGLQVFFVLSQRLLALD